MPAPGAERSFAVMQSKLFVYRACLLSVLLLLQAAVPGQSTNEQISSVTVALRAGEFDRALALLRPALRSAPNNPQLWMFEVGSRVIPACIEGVC
jgi:hypothetical protein